jgi:hypothetical protein
LRVVEPSTDEIKRRAQFVADVGGELCFELARVLGDTASFDQGAVHLFDADVSLFQHFNRAGGRGSFITQLI